MKSTPTADALFASSPVWRRDLGSEQSDHSLFSLLLEIETRLLRKHDGILSFRLSGEDPRQAQKL